MGLSREQALLEYAKCVKDTPYALKTYLQTYDNTQSQYVPLELFPDQINLINDYDTYEENIALKYRQAGVSTVTAAWSSKKLVTASKKKPEKILIIANKLDTSMEFANKVRSFVDQWPTWFGITFSAEKNSQRHFKLSNGCEVKAVATSKDALRGYTPTILIFDEAAFIDADDDFWSACMASLSTGGKVIVISTPNGFDPIYYTIYDQALRGMNDFKITEMFWYRDPRYAKDFKLIKCKDIVHYMLNREDYNDDEIIIDYSHINPRERNFKEIKEKLLDGYKAYSSWFEGMAKKLKFDRRKIAQELECNFLGSGDNVIPNETIEVIKEKFIRNPENKFMGGALWQWKEPIEGHKYIMGCLPPNEKVLTNKGLKNIEDVTLDDKLISENGDYVNIINKQIYQVVDENVFEMQVDNTFRTTTFTKEHPILVSKSNLKRNYKKNHNKYKFNERYWDFDFNYVRAEDVKVGDWVKVPNIYKTRNNTTYNEKWKINKNIRCDFEFDSPLLENDFWWFIGMWLGDGWLGKNKHSYTISICFDKNHEEYVEKCEKIIKRLFNRSSSLVNGESTFELVFNSKFLYYFILENFGQYSYGKKIPEWVKFISNEHKKELIRGYFDSDGCWIKTEKNNKINSKISFVSVNLELLESIQDIIFSLGVISCLNRLRNKKVTKICNKECVQRETYNLILSNHDSLDLINLIYKPNDPKLNKFEINDFTVINKRIISSCHFDDDKDFIFFRVKNINKSKFSGNVYNFECDTHTFMCHHITTHNCDVSRGDSEDFTTFTIIDFDEREQVLEYLGKVPPDVIAEIAFKWATMYSAFIVIDITGGMGVSTSRKLQEMGYKNLYVEGVNSADKWKYNPKVNEKIPGLNFNSKRVQIVASFEESLRHNFAIRSSRLLNELNTFVYINGRPDHQKGQHDDLIMAIAMAIYVGENSFTQLEKVTEQTKAMMESWMVNETPVKNTSNEFNPNIPVMPGGINQNRMNRNATKDDYKNHSWLFGKF